MIFFMESNEYTPTGLALYHTLSRTIASDSYFVDVEKTESHLGFNFDKYSLKAL